MYNRTYWIREIAKMMGALGHRIDKSDLKKIYKMDTTKILEMYGDLRKQTMGIR